MKYSPRLEEIKNKILNDKIKVISFDIFDTLLVRPCLEPTDLFSLVKRRLELDFDFVSLRKYAEKYARKKKYFYYDDITLSEIYKEFQSLTGSEKTEVDAIMQMELQVEKEYLKPRQAIQSLYYDAIENNKKVIITSDMYLPKDFLAEVLEKNGYSGYEHIFVSSEERVAKGTGRLFQKIIGIYSREGIEANQIVHLGDNARADVAMPKQQGMEAYHLPAPGGIFRSKKKLEPIWRYAKRTDNTFIVGALANYLFDDPYKPFHVDSISGGRASDFGAIIFGQMFLIYAKWLYEKANADNIEKLLLVYRDGYLLECIFEILDEKLKLGLSFDKIFLSRRIRYPFYAEERNGLANALDNFACSNQMTVKEFINKRVCIAGEKEEEVWEIFSKYGYGDIDEPLGNQERYFFFLNELMPYFQINAHKFISDTREYVKMKTEGHKIGVVDIGYRGSVSRFLWDKVGVKNQGYQLMATPKNNMDIKPQYKISSFYSYSFSVVDRYNIFHQLLEDVVSIQEGTAIAIKKEGEDFSVIKEKKSSCSKVLNDIQQGILDFVKYAISVLYPDFMEMEFDKALYFDLLESFFVRPFELDARILKQMDFKDSDFIICDQIEYNPYIEWYKRKFSKNNMKSVTPNKKEVTQQKIISNQMVDGIEDREKQPWEKISKPHLMAIKICEKTHMLNTAIQVKQVLLARQRREKATQEYLLNNFSEPMNKKLSDLKSKWQTVDNNSSTILIAGAMTSFDKGTCNFINMLANELRNCKVLLMSENKFLNEERTRQKISIPFFLIPEFLCKDQYDKVNELWMDKKIKKFVDDVEYLKWGKENLLERHEDMCEAYAYYMVYYANLFIENMLNVIKPSKVILWNEFYAFHHILKNHCLKNKVEIVYMEFGSIPGTISLEKIGQMGKSFPGCKYKEFITLPITKEDKKKAEKLIEFLRESRMNRNVQPINNNIMTVRNKLKKGRPVILYAGVNDYESGLVPYSTESKNYHSPLVKSSEEGLAIISKIAQVNDWNVIYKPHPIIESRISDWNRFDDCVVVARSVDINDVIDLADVVVTILSQVCYTALIRNKPVLMLGYTQLRGKKVCYEAYEENSLEHVLKKAVEEGQTKEQKENFIVHVAQMNKYNLFNDLQNKPMDYAQTIQQAARYITDCDNSVEWYKQNC